MTTSYTRENLAHMTRAAIVEYLLEIQSERDGLANELTALRRAKPVPELEQEMAGLKMTAQTLGLANARASNLVGQALNVNHHLRSDVGDAWVDGRPMQPETVRMYVLSLRQKLAAVQDALTGNEIVDDEHEGEHDDPDYHGDEGHYRYGG